MLNLSLAVTLTIANLVYAAIIYLSLHGWLVGHDTSGTQLLMHLIITAPLVLITTIWFFYLSKQEKCSSIFWKLNLVGFLIPVMSFQTGVTYYHFDKIGLATSVLLAVSVFILYLTEVRRNARS